MSPHEFRSAVGSRLAQLDQAVRQLRAALAPLESALPDDAALEANCRAAVEHGAEVRALLRRAAEACGGKAKSWSNRAGLDAAVAALAERLTARYEAPRRLLRRLAAELRDGDIRHRRPGRQAELNRLRLAALDEVERAIASDGTVRTIGPEDDDGWMAWWWSIPPAEQEQLLAPLATELPALHAFLDALEPSQWGPTADLADLAVVEPPPAPAPPPPEPEPAEPAAAEPPAPEPFPEGPPPTLADELFSFDRFRRHFWMAPDGECAAAPWADRTDFLRRIGAGCFAALQSQHFPRAWLFARAAERLDHNELPRPTDVAAFAALWAHPLDAAAGVDEGRAVMVHEAHGVAATPRWRLALFVEALRPSHERFFTAEDVDLLLGEVDFLERGLAKVVRGLLLTAAHGVAPTPRLREAFRARTLESLDVLTRRLADRRQSLHRTVKELWMAAGGTIQQTHCRDAWDEFIAAIRPDVETLFPEDRHGGADWDVARMRQRIAGFTAEHHRVVEDHGVKFGDLRAANSAVRRIVQDATEVNDLMDQVHRASGKRPGLALTQLPVDAVRGLVEGDPLDDPLEECCRLLLARCLAAEPNGDAALADPLAVPLADLIAWPELLGLLEPGTPLGPSAAFHADDVRDPVQAAAVLLTERPAAAHAERPTAALIDRLRWHPDEELLARAAGLLGQVRDQERVHEKRALRVESLRSRRAQLAGLRQTLDDLAVLHSLRDAEAEADGLIDAAIAGSLPPALLGEWLARLCGFAEKRRDHEAALIRARACREADPARRDAILAAIEAGRFSALLPLLLGRGDPRPPGIRETCWRHEVESRFGTPDRAALRLVKLKEPTAAAWQPLQGQVTAADRPIRTTFARLVFPDEPFDGHPSLYSQGENDAHHFAMPTRSIRAYLAAVRPGPSYLPQLGRFGRVVLLTPAVPPGSQKFRERLGTQLAAHKDDLSVVLVPRASSSFRRECQEWCRGHNAAVLDDYDLCRLLLPDVRPHPLLGMLEIVFEQLPWLKSSPFVADDGQRVPLEMFVGRRSEAADVARTGRYSRLFSGRKLGKSALLRFIVETYQGHALPSGCRLRVVYVPAAGMESEAALVKGILDALRARSLALEPADGNGSADADRLVAMLAHFRDKRPNESLLIILDEADVFVEEQVRRYHRDKEKSLSFKIRNQVMSVTDGHGLPRVRVLYSGYRATNTREGVWAGSGGHVLRLEPLPLQDAAALIAGPLARLGIDAADEAVPIAHRCGCQPAVLLRFGECLLEHLERLHSAGQRDRVPVRVTTAHVAEVFNSKDVHDEIWSVTSGNFQGNERGFIVFIALALEFAARSPGAALEDAEPVVLARLEALTGELGWLARDGDDRAGALGVEFRDLVERRLLVERPGQNGPSYSLQFPHHLPSLLRRNLKHEAEQALARLLEGEQDAQARSLLPRAKADGLHDSLFKADSIARAAVVGSLWSEAVEDSPGSVPDRLGIPPNAVCDGATAVDGQLRADPLAVRGASPEVAQRLLRGRPAGLRPPLLLGGADLLRWALPRCRDDSLEVVGVGRLPANVLRWWFQRVRGFEFDRHGAMTAIARQTSGIPLLVAAFDRLLRGGEAKAGTTISARVFDEAVAQFAAEADGAAGLLRGGPPSCRLTPRELDLLRMIAVVCGENGYDENMDLAAALTADWELYRELCPTPPLDPTGEDAVSVELLLGLGLLPGRVDRPAGRPLERLAVPAADDALWRLLTPRGVPQ